MTISEDVLNILNYLENYSEGGLRKRDDLGILLEFAANSDNDEAFGNLLFYGSALSKLYLSLRKATPNDEAFKLLETEFTKSAENIRDAMANILSVCRDDEIISNFESKYYNSTQGSLRNLIDIAIDLNRLKQVQNDEKR